MKNRILFLIALFATTIVNAQLIAGAWKEANEDAVLQTTIIIADNYFMQADYDVGTKNFLGALGGTNKVTGDGKITVVMEFNTADKNLVGQTYVLDYKFDNGNLVIGVNGENTTYTRIDNPGGELAGNWRITDREQDGKMVAMKPGPRKTLKILSGTRFQWAAFNTETKEFFGTGGGTYKFVNGKYTENIDFFSRDSSRVGISLEFSGAVNGKKWEHSGKSSKGEKMAEIWTRQVE